MDCKACEEIYMHFFAKHLYELVPSFMICLDEDFSYQVKIPKDHLSSEIMENLSTKIQLNGPTGQTHEIVAHSTGDTISLASGWNNFVSCYNLRRQDKLVFYYKGNCQFHVKAFDQNGCEITEPRDVGHTTAQSGSSGRNGKGKQGAEAEASSGVLRAKRGRVEHNNSIIEIDSEEFSGPVKKRKLTPPELMEISSHSGGNDAQLANDADPSGSRYVANSREVPSKGSTGNEKDDSFEFISVCSRTAMGQTRKESSHTEEENLSTDPVHDEVAPATLQREVISISSGSSNDNGDEEEGLCSPNLRVKKAKRKAPKDHLKILRELQNKGMEVGKGTGSGNRDAVMIQKGGRAAKGVRDLNPSRDSPSQRTRGKHRARALNVYYDEEEAAANYTTKIMKTHMKSSQKTTRRSSKLSSYTEEESRTTDSVEIMAPPPVLVEMISISSGFFHDNANEAKGQCSTILRVKNELDTSGNSDNEVTTNFAPKSRFVSVRKLVTNKEKEPHQVSIFRSENPHFAKRMTKTNVQTRFCLNILTKFARDNLPTKHCTMTLRLPQGSNRWRVECWHSCQCQTQWYINKGWFKFARDNNLEVDDWCLFELTCKEKLEMKVHIFKTIDTCS